jgi:hypothetical protein
MGQFDSDLGQGEERVANEDFVRPSVAGSEENRGP